MPSAHAAWFRGTRTTRLSSDLPRKPSVDVRDTFLSTFSASNIASSLRSRQKPLWQNTGRLSWRRGEGCCSIGCLWCCSTQTLEDARLCEAGCSIESGIIGIEFSDSMWDDIFAYVVELSRSATGVENTLRRSALRAVLSIIIKLRLNSGDAIRVDTSPAPCFVLHRLNITEGCTFHELVKIEWNGREWVPETHQRALMGSTCAGGQRILSTPSSFSTCTSFFSEEEEEDFETLPGR
jgi:hypothetical protein